MPCMRAGDCICCGIRSMGCAYWRNIGDQNWRHPDDELSAILRDSQARSADEGTGPAQSEGSVANGDPK